MPPRKKRARRRRPQQGRSRALVDSIVEATFDLFRRTEQPPSIRSIAERAGVGVGSIYEYFASREGVLDAVVERFTAENFERFDGRVRDGEATTTEALCLAILDEMIEIYVGQPALTRSAIRVILGFGRLGAITAKRDVIANRIAKRVGEAYPRVPLETVERSVQGVADMAMGVLVSELYREGRDFDQRAMLVRLVRGEIAHVAALDAKASDAEV